MEHNKKLHANLTKGIVHKKKNKKKNKKKKKKKT